MNIQNVYTDKLDDIVNEYNNACHNTIKIKSVDIKSSTYSDFGVKNNYKDPKFQGGHHMRISKYKSIFGKRYVPDWSEEVFVIKKVKDTVLWTYVFSDLNNEEIIGTFHKKEFQKTNQTQFRIEKVIKKKGNKLCVK